MGVSQRKAFPAQEVVPGDPGRLSPLCCALSYFAHEATLPPPPITPALLKEGSVSEGSPQPENQEPRQNGLNTEENVFFLITCGPKLGSSRASSFRGSEASPRTQSPSIECPHRGPRWCLLSRRARRARTLPVVHLSHPPSLTKTSSRSLLQMFLHVSLARNV